MFWLRVSVSTEPVAAWPERAPSRVRHAATVHAPAKPLCSLLWEPQGRLKSTGALHARCPLA